MPMDKTLSEYERDFYVRETGSTSKNLAELKKLYYDAKVPGSGTVADKELAYLRSKTGLTTGSISDLEAAYFALVTGVRSAGNTNRRDYYKNAPVGN